MIKVKIKKNSVTETSASRKSQEDFMKHHKSKHGEEEYVDASGKKHEFPWEIEDRPDIVTPEEEDNG